MSILLIGQSGSVSAMLIWIILLIAFVVGGGLVILGLRRRMLLDKDSISIGSSGLLDHIHELHRSGEIDDDEYSRARNAILHRVQEDIEARMNTGLDSKIPVNDELDIDH